MEHFKQELVDYLEDYNARRIQAKLKGLPPAGLQTTSPFSCLNDFFSKILSNFWGALHSTPSAGFSKLSEYSDETINGRTAASARPWRPPL